MTTSARPKNLVVTVAAGYREAQIRPFLASLAHYSPNVSLRLITDRINPEFEDAVRAWIPDSSLHLLPPAGLRNFALKRKWARSILKRLARWLPPPNFGRRLLKINYVRHIVIHDLFRSWNLEQERVLLVDSRDLVFQSDPFSGDWPHLWSGEEDKRIGDCSLNSFWLHRAGGPEALQKAKHHLIVCAGVIGGQADRIRQYLQRSSAVVEGLACQVALDDGDQGIHNNLVRLSPDLGFTVLRNGSPLVANVSYTMPDDLIIEHGQVRLLRRDEVPAILHQYDRHPKLVALIQSKWDCAKPSAFGC